MRNTHIAVHSRRSSDPECNGQADIVKTANDDSVQQVLSTAFPQRNKAKGLKTSSEAAEEKVTPLKVKQQPSETEISFLDEDFKLLLS